MGTGGERNGEVSARPFCLWQPPHVCLCGGAELPGVECRLWGDDCYSTGAGFKNAFLMGNAFHRQEQRGLESQRHSGGALRFSVSSGVGEARLISGNSLPSAAGRLNDRKPLQTPSPVRRCCSLEFYTHAISACKRVGS